MMSVEYAARALTQSAYLRLSKGETSEIAMRTAVDEVWQMNEGLAQEVLEARYERRVWTKIPPVYLFLAGMAVGLAFGIGITMSVVAR